MRPAITSSKKRMAIFSTVILASIAIGYASQALASRYANKPLELNAMSPERPSPEAGPYIFAQHQAHPCQDGRFSDGQPRDCEGLLRWLDEGGDGGVFLDERFHRPEPVDPCTDGRFNDGRPRSCSELLRWLRGMN